MNLVTMNVHAVGGPEMARALLARGNEVFADKLSESEAGGSGVNVEAGEHEIRLSILYATEEPPEPTCSAHQATRKLQTLLDEIFDPSEPLILSIGILVEELVARAAGTGWQRRAGARV